MRPSILRHLATALAVAVTVTAAEWGIAEAGRRAHAAGSDAIYVAHHGKGHKHKKWKKRRGHQVRKHHRRSHRFQRHPRYGNVRYTFQRHGRDWHLRPRYGHTFVLRRPRYYVVRPVPYWVYPYHRHHRSGIVGRVGVNIGNVDLSFRFADRDPYYGCNFCHAYYDDYDDYADHVVACRYGPRVRVIAEHWDDHDLDYFRARAEYAYGDRFGYDDDDYDYDD